MLIKINEKEEVIEVLSFTASSIYCKICGEARIISNVSKIQIGLGDNLRQGEVVTDDGARIGFKIISLSAE